MRAVRRIGDHGQRLQGRALHLDLARMLQRVAHIRRGILIAQQAGGFKRGDLDLFFQIAQQKRDARSGGRIADLLDRDQRFVHQLVVLGMQRLDQIGNRGASAQNADGSGGVRARIEVRAAARQLSQRGNHFGPHLDIGVDHPVVGVREFAFDRIPGARKRSAEPGLDVTRDVDVHQAVGGADLHFGIVIADGLDQTVHRLRTADLYQRLDRLNAHV